MVSGLLKVKVHGLERLRFVCSDNGIGMSVVKGFTELMGGKLSVESKEGDGSTFTVDIPFSTAS